ncbi:hypothetical protein CR194_07450 [Salipaludibacillus keqinensis]|uniref:Uncharacterized protein n=1 Tax=Salipaludibacillus keqinensis TaxID=2045207 RepID=A0A323TEK3_9BACI|nr:hypothetical protein CR194_07450 [Salipaludibacillus keqinensis]
MTNQKSTRKLEIGFHIFIILFAIFIIISSILEYEETERTTVMWILMGVLIGLSSIFRLIKLVKRQ